MSNLTPEQVEMLYQIQGCAEVGEGYYHDPVTDGLILALAALTAPAPAEGLEDLAECPVCGTLTTAGADCETCSLEDAL